MPESVSLDLGCPHCGGKVTAEFADWNKDGPIIDAVLACPFCSREWRAGVPARLIWVTKRRASSDLRH